MDHLEHRGSLAKTGSLGQTAKTGKMAKTGSLVAWGHKDHRETQARGSLFPMALKDRL
jgi:trehalose utilization protein